MDERPGAPPAGSRRAPRGLQPLPAAPGGRRLARAARRARAPSAHAVVCVRPAAPAHRRLPLLLRADARAALAAVPAPRHPAQEVGDALPRLGHPRQALVRARLREAGGGRGRGVVRRHPLGTGGGDDPAGHRRARDRAVSPLGPPAADDRPRALVTAPEGHRARRRRLRRPRRRPRPRRGAPARRGVRALPRRGHRRRPAERRLVRRLRDRVHGTRKARRHLPAGRGGRADGARARGEGADRQRDCRDATGAPRAARRDRGRAEADRSRVALLRRARTRLGARRRPPALSLRSALSCRSARN